MEHGLQKANHYNQLAYGRSEWRPAEKAGGKSVSGARNKGSRFPPTTASSESPQRRRIEEMAGLLQEGGSAHSGRMAHPASLAPGVL